MKKLILAFCAFLITAASIKAQDKVAVTTPHGTSFGIAINAGIPVGDAASTVYSFSAGADVQADFALSTNLRGTLSAGYQTYTVKEAFRTFLGEKSSSLIPLLAGVKYFFSPKFFGHGQVGYAFSTESGGGGHFAWAPSLGYLVSNNFDISVKYLSVGDLNALLLRLALSLGGKK